MKRWRVTGVSAPWGGLQWEYLDGDAEIARRVIAVLEDRRMLWVPYAWELPEHVMESAKQVRDALTAEINTKGIGPDLVAMLKEVRKLFTNFMTPQIRHDWEFDAERVVTFHEKLGALRAGVGERLALLAAKYNLPIDDELRSIVPDTGAWFYESFDPAQP